MNCDFKNVQWWNAEFVRCTFTGTFSNIVFYGPEAPEGLETLLSEVDLSGVQMIDTDFRTGIDLSSTRMPAV